MCLFPNHGYPCGKCIECLARKRNDWSIRLQAQLRYMDKGKMAFFCTPTYDEEHVPIYYTDGDLDDSDTIVSVRGLCKMDCQKFIKRVRRYVEYHYGIKNLKFYMAGEYGPKTYRPHYHLIMFGFPKMRLNELDAILQMLWKNGEVRRPSLLSEARCHYATKYMIFEDFLPENPYAPKPFKLMSNGLGKQLADLSTDFSNRFYGSQNPEDVYLTACEFWQNLKRPGNSIATKESMFASPDFDLDAYNYVLNSCCDVIIHDGKKYQIPRYIREKVYPKEIRMILNLRKKFLVEDRQKEYYDKWFDYDVKAIEEGMPPMWKQLANEKYNRLRSSFNKKYKKDKPNNKLLD